MPVYSIAIIAFDDVSPAFSTTETVGGSVDGDTFTIASGAEPITIRIDDDDAEFDDGFIDPPGNSTGANNQLVAEPVTINGVSYGPPSAGGTPQDQVELEFAFTTTDGDTYYVVRIDGVNVGLSGPTLPQPGQTFTIDSTSDGEDAPYDDIPCFVSGTLIDTPMGERPVETLEPGDLVETVDDGPQPLLRNLSTVLSRDRLGAMPNLRPIHFAPDTVGNTRAMRLSPQHRVLIRGWRAELLFGETEVLVPAKALVNGRDVRIVPPTVRITYHHLLFDRHQLVISDGAITESLYPQGAIARGTEVQALREFAALFGTDPVGERPSALLVRPVITMRDAQVLRQTPPWHGAAR
ncbi:MAG: Hint domain-containing protein [Pseudomonadota bacterium]